MLEKILKLDGVTVLNKKEQGTIFGGGGCFAYLPNGGGNTTSFETPNGGASISGSGITFRNISKTDAMNVTGGVVGAKWCCDSCSEASWLREQVFLDNSSFEEL